MSSENIVETDIKVGESHKDVLETITDYEIILVDLFRKYGVRCSHLFSHFKVAQNSFQHIPRLRF